MAGVGSVSPVSCLVRPDPLGPPLAPGALVLSQPAPDDEVLEPLRNDEQELDGLLARARAAAEQTIEAAEAAAQELRAAARRDLAVELQALAEARLRQRGETSDARKAELARRVATLRESAAARHDEAMASILGRVTGLP